MLLAGRDMECETTLGVRLVRLDGGPGSGMRRAVTANLDVGYGLVGLAVDHHAAQRPAADDGHVRGCLGTGPHAQSLHGPGGELVMAGHSPEQEVIHSRLQAADEEPPLFVAHALTVAAQDSHTVLEELGAQPHAFHGPAGRVRYRTGDPSARLEDQRIQDRRIGLGAGTRAEIPRVRRPETGANPFRQQQYKPPGVVGDGGREQPVGFPDHEVERTVDRIGKTRDVDLDSGDRLARLVHDRALDAMGQRE